MLSMASVDDPADWASVAPILAIAEVPAVAAQAAPDASIGWVSERLGPPLTGATNHHSSAAHGFYVSDPHLTLVCDGTLTDAEAGIIRNMGVLGTSLVGLTGREITDGIQQSFTVQEPGWYSVEFTGTTSVLVSSFGHDVKIGKHLAIYDHRLETSLLKDGELLENSVGAYHPVYKQDYTLKEAVEDALWDSSMVVLGNIKAVKDIVDFAAGLKWVAGTVNNLLDLKVDEPFAVRASGYLEPGVTYTWDLSSHMRMGAAAVGLSGIISYSKMNVFLSDVSLKQIGVPEVCLVNVSSGAHGSVYPSGEHRVEPGSSITFYALPDSSYAVDQWKFDDDAMPWRGNVIGLGNIRNHTDVSVSFTEAATSTIKVYSPLGKDYEDGKSAFLLTRDGDLSRPLTVYGELEYDFGPGTVPLILPGQAAFASDESQCEWTFDVSKLNHFQDLTLKLRLVPDPNNAGAYQIDQEQVATPLVFPGNEIGTEYLVTSLADNTNTDGQVTLREAMEAANGTSPVGDAPAGSNIVDVIRFDPSLFSGGPAKIELGGTQLSAILGYMRIIGPGAELLTIDGKNQSRVLYVGNTRLDVSGVTIANGQTPAGASNGYGAGILVGGTNAELRLDDVTVTGTENGTFGYGGAIQVYDARRVEIRNSRIVDNPWAMGFAAVDAPVLIDNTRISGNAQGGAGTVRGDMQIRDSVVDGNAYWEGIGATDADLLIVNSRVTNNTEAEYDGQQYGGGGGIRGNATVTVVNSLIAGNRSYNTSGAGVEGEKVVAVNSVFVGNSAWFHGGGIYATDAEVTNCTFYRNSAGTWAGGGVYFTNSLLLNNSILGYSGIYTPSNGSGAVDRNSSNNLLDGNVLWGSMENALVDGAKGNMVGRDLGWVAEPSAGDDGLWGTADDVLPRLASYSLAIDGGENSLLPADAQDVDDDGNTAETVPLGWTGNPRQLGGAVDIGAEEFDSPWARIDSILPEGQIASDATLSFSATSGTSQGAAIAFEWTSDLDGPLSQEQDFQLAASTLSGGAHTISFRAFDITGKASDWAAQTIQVAATMPELSIGNAVQLEGNSGTADLAFTVTLSAEADRDVTVAYATADQTATAGEDYTLAADTLTIPKGALSATVTVSILGDTEFEPNETFSLTLSAPSGATILQGTAQGTIENDDPAPLPLLSVACVTLESLDLSGGSLFYEVETSHDGLLTIEAIAPKPSKSARLRLFDQNPVDNPSAAPLEVSTLVGENQRIDRPTAAGATFFLEIHGTNTDFDVRVANLVHHDASAGTVTVFGTDADDAFEFDASASRVVTINGVRYSFDDSQVATVTFDGGQGFDMVTLRDSAGDETLVAEPGSATLTNHAGEFSVAVSGFEELQAYASAGGDDRATLHDSPGKDKFKGEPAVAKMYKGGVFYHRVKFFDVVQGISTQGEDDARLWDSPGDDRLESQRDETRLQGAGFDVTASGFPQVYTRASNGGFDTAIVTDSPLDDTVRARAHKVMIWAGDYEDPIYKLTARTFDEVYLHATRGGFDRAKLHDTLRDDLLEVTPDWVQLSAQKEDLDMLYRAMAFEWVKAYSVEGRDTVRKPDVVDFVQLELDGPWFE
jgi:hypothetical protein